MRIHFDELFTIKNSMIHPRTVIVLNGVSIGPGISFGSGVSFGGIDLSQLIGKDIDVEPLPNGGYKVLGYYNPPY